MAIVSVGAGTSAAGSSAATAHAEAVDNLAAAAVALQVEDSFDAAKKPDAQAAVVFNKADIQESANNVGVQITEQKGVVENTADLVSGLQTMLLFVPETNPLGQAAKAVCTQTQEKLSALQKALEGAEGLQSNLHQMLKSNASETVIKEKYEALLQTMLRVASLSTQMQESFKELAGKMDVPTLS